MRATSETAQDDGYTARHGGDARIGIGVGVFYIELGAIAAFGVEADVGWVDVNTVGWVMVFVGAVRLLVSLVMTPTMPWRRARREERAVDDRR